MLAQILKLQLVSPDDDLIVQLPERWLGRKIHLSTLGQAATLAFPCFIKPLIPKLFKAGIYINISDLHHAIKNLPPETAIICSEIIDIQAEARGFIKNGYVLTCATYEGHSCSLPAQQFIQHLLDNCKTCFPSTCVIDVALKSSGQWVFLESNATWGAGLNGCDPQAAAQCIAVKALTVYRPYSLVTPVFTKHIHLWLIQ